MTTNNPINENPIKNNNKVLREKALIDSGVNDSDYILPEKGIPLDPTNGGRSITYNLLCTADIILSTTKDWISLGIKAITNSEISHAILYIGNNIVVEAIKEGIVKRDLNDALRDATVAVAFRHQGINSKDAERIVEYAINAVGKPYNVLGIVKQLGFRLDLKTYCPKKSDPRYEICKNWAGSINLGKATDNSFFCSELVLKSYEVAGYPLTLTPPHWIAPGDIVNLSFQKGILGYVGHLRA